ncbi:MULTISPECIES: hypothetical protein [Bradyrhizobium]|uniref:hypothetical protein n=1 Tax=Bradyrhizobium TaxID=374 RepID=UPI001ED9DE09|nr:hypothetical protein [Bradyrhizobium zhengyangense]MCG2639659.1 hypothetical protein [Bradyrhizobium zhengyangense]
MTAEIVGLPGWPPVFRGVPLTDAEKRVYGAEAERCEITGFIFECGIGAAPKEVQTERFKANLRDPKWVVDYLRSDPQACVRHPALYGAFKSKASGDATA